MSPYGIARILDNSYLPTGFTVCTELIGRSGYPNCTRSDISLSTSFLEDANFVLHSCQIEGLTVIATNTTYVDLALPSLLNFGLEH
jgi:hypothetical protein